MRFAIFRNRKNVGEDAFAGSGAREIRIVPVIAGSARRAAADNRRCGANGRQYLDWTYYLQIGAALTLGGVAQMLSPKPGPEPVSRPGEPAQLRLRQCEEHRQR